MNEIDLAYDTQINDKREMPAFKGVTFSKFKLTDVKKQLLESLIAGKIEPSSYWTAELVCSGHFNELWEILLGFYSKYIHLANPKIAVYLDLRVDGFQTILRQGYKENELQLRNHSRIRFLFAEIICILCCAKRKHHYEGRKIKREAFDISEIGDNLKAPNTSYLEKVFKEKDPKEVFVAMNELAFHLSKDSRNVPQACFWIEWILEFETLCKKNVPAKLTCERRAHIPVSSKDQMDIVWIIWEIIQETALKADTSPFLQRTVESVLKLFCLRYTHGCAKKRKFLIYFAVSLLCENPVVATEAAKEEIVREEDKHKVSGTLKNMDMVYKQIKKNEESPGTEYLFADVKGINLKKTMEKLQAIDSFDDTFVPRETDP